MTISKLEKSGSVLPLLSEPSSSLFFPLIWMKLIYNILSLHIFPEFHLMLRFPNTLLGGLWHFFFFEHFFLYHILTLDLFFFYKMYASSVHEEWCAVCMCTLKTKQEHQLQIRNCVGFVDYLLTQTDHLANILLYGTENYFADPDECLENVSSCSPSLDYDY